MQQCRPSHLDDDPEVSHRGRLRYPEAEIAAKNLESTIG
jgi:hypothetical protein